MKTEPLHLYIFYIYIHTYIYGRACMRGVSKSVLQKKEKLNDRIKVHEDKKKKT